MSNKRELLKLLPLVRQQVAREISANHSSGGLFARGTAGEGFAGGYMAALDDIEAELSHGYPGDQRGYWRAARAAAKGSQP